MASPSDDFVYHWLWSQQENTGITKAQAALQMLGWSVSAKRIKRLRTSSPPNVALLRALVDLPRNRDDLSSAFMLRHVSGAGDNDGILRLSTAMGGQPIDVVGVLYPSNQDVIQWYYECYAVIGDTTTKKNMVASAVFDKDVRGDVLIVKNYAGSVPTNADLFLNLRDVTKVLWYYLASGINPVVVSSQRTLERMLVQ
ncbi:hypothetical protein C8R44DRAFT_752541 [Mycena epipterygia]|nr:hypothetical protein C8R44DRAFT_752541 [Mycena epipterygia]